MTAVFDWTTARDGLGQWINDVTGLHVQDMNGPQEWGGSLIEAAPVPVEALTALILGRGIGVDDTIKHYNDAATLGEEIELKLQGLRELTWEIRVESRSSDPGEDATSYIEIMRSLLRDRVARLLFKGLGIGLRGIGNTTNLNERRDNRLVSVAQMDVALHAYVDVEGSRYGYIDTVDVTTEWRDPGGALFPPEMQTDGEL
jgi:hypothetical protein